MKIASDSNLPLHFTLLDSDTKGGLKGELLLAVLSEMHVSRKLRLFSFHLGVQAKLAVLSEFMQV